MSVVQTARFAALAVAAAGLLAVTTAAQSTKPQGVTFRSPGGTTLRLMIDETNLGAEVSLGEITFRPP